MRLLPLAIITCFLLIGPALSHQPRMPTGEGLIQVQNPEVSQAFYSQLGGEPHYYQIVSAENFTLYVSILVPDVPGIGKDVSARITRKDEHEEGEGHEHEVLYLLNGTDYEWKHYYEEFGGDYYYSGPEMKHEVEPGTYDIEVSSPDNSGKYVLVVGQKEKFPLNEFVNTVLTLPRLKQFFEKPAYTAYFNLIGVFMLVILGAVALAAGLVYKLFAKKGKKK